MKYIFIVYLHDTGYPYHDMLTQKTKVFENFENAQEYCNTLNGDYGCSDYRIAMFEINPSKTGSYQTCQAYD